MSVISSLVFLNLILSVSAAIWSYKSYSDLTDPTCQNERKKSSRLSLICDPDYFLDFKVKAKLNELMWDINLNSMCDCTNCKNESTGYTVAIAIAESIKAPFLTSLLSLDDEVKEFGKKLRLRWHVGKCDDDMLIVLCPKCHRKIWAEKGRLMAKRFPFDLDLWLDNSVLTELLSAHNYTGLLTQLLTEFHSELTLSNATLAQILAVRQAVEGGIPTGVLSVLVLTTLLSIGWTACVTYILVEFFLRKRQIQADRVSRHSSSLSRNSHRQSLFINQSAIVLD